ncbi:hypothetical protein EIN_429360 [Entamoeba invadens IP1]|uniref:Uncharacterized protein n=1 Tax=Entamoeba invadens IP1 TaxID=370355 RepID=A0A0A1UF03_ENTIV|nr:hypothetical protein EIN_429360 [Entamoeba invadens IP1]ELP95170.1 hypothetical protein EIN_429360 [Entamoeba invadens IP1]|eukprot:XP_004261941.1 hypothetical protein EIN_429360 [Entamoeba invadens IP1]
MNQTNFVLESATWLDLHQRKPNWSKTVSVHPLFTQSRPDTPIPPYSFSQKIEWGDNCPSLIMFEYVLEDPVLILNSTSHIIATSLFGEILQNEKVVIPVTQHNLKTTDFLIVKNQQTVTITEPCRVYSAHQIFFTQKTDIPNPLSDCARHTLESSDSVEKRILQNEINKIENFELLQLEKEKKQKTRSPAERIIEELQNKKLKNNFPNEVFETEENVLMLPWNHLEFDWMLLHHKMVPFVTTRFSIDGRLRYFIDHVNYRFAKRKKEKWMKLDDIKRELNKRGIDDWRCDLNHDGALEVLRNLKRRDNLSERDLSAEEIEFVRTVIDKQRDFDFAYLSQRVGPREAPKIKGSKNVRNCISAIVDGITGLSDTEKDVVRDALLKTKKRMLKRFQNDIPILMEKCMEGRKDELTRSLVDLAGRYMEEE